MKRGAAAAAPKSLAENAEAVILGPNPFVGFRLRDVLRGGLKAALLAAQQPRRTVKTGLQLANALRDVALRQSSLGPSPKDRRFGHPDWQNQPLYRAWMQSYLAWTQIVAQWLDEQTQLTATGRARLEFVLSLFNDAVAPSNFPWQPEAMARFRETGGRSAVEGLRQLGLAIRSNRGLPEQVDKSQFEVGRNLANTAGAVVLRTELIELIQYQPRHAQVHTVPLLIVPPQINKFYVFDLTAEKSVVGSLLDQGQQVFMVSWRNPKMEHRNWGLSDYAMAIDDAISAACAITEASRVNLVGACAGGMTLASYVAARATAGDQRIASMTLLVNVLDVSATGETPLGLFATPAVIEAAKRYSRSKGVLDGKDMATAFAWLRPNDLIWSYWVNNILLGRKPPAFDVLYWNNDSTRLPARLHAEFLDIYQSNALTRPGTLHLRGVPVDLGKIACEVYLVAGTTDHITPWKACFRSIQLFGGKTSFVLSNSGHIQSILSPPGNKKAEFWTGGVSDTDPEEWLRTASRHAGSWWSHWHGWLAGHAGVRSQAPAAAGSRRFPVLAPAPGTYVLE